MCVCGGGGNKANRGRMKYFMEFNRSSCDVMEWVQELVHCEGGLD